MKPKFVPTKEQFENTVQRLRRVANTVDGRVRSYSGRCMYGRECLAIVCDDSTQCIEEAAAEGFRGANQDSLGMRSIVYWPRMEIPEGFEIPEDND